MLLLEKRMAPFNKNHALCPLQLFAHDSRMWLTALSLKRKKKARNISAVINRYCNLSVCPVSSLFDKVMGRKK